MTTTGAPAPEAAPPACCTAPAATGLDDDRAATLARVFKALGEPARVRLLSLVAAQEGHEACVCDLTAPVGLSQPTVSHHLKVLVEAGLLTRSQRGRWAYYALTPGALDQVSEDLRSL
ncbi:metalloregulator ArsR/SmtB family transcription factor [Isoptericola haloaureus]|uniref:Metalloregulator ArsR/SmtB family transcription factor n=1 Tax=Isoptericola haloaureus TaxID=1542902 RepID=A0ABU7ZAI7_9MICO